MSLQSVHEKYFRTLEPWFIILFGDLYFLTNFSVSNSAAFGETFLCYGCIDCCFTWKISSFLLPPYPVVLANVKQDVFHFFLLYLVPYFTHTSFSYYISNICLFNNLGIVSFCTSDTHKVNSKNYWTYSLVFQGIIPGSVPLKIAPTQFPQLI